MSQINKHSVDFFPNKIDNLISPVLLFKSFPVPGAVAQLGERMNGIHEAVGSIPISSTKEN